MLVSRGAALNTLIAGGVGTTVGGAAYGLAYSRHNIEIVRTTIPVSGLAPALDALRIGLISAVYVPYGLNCPPDVSVIALKSA